MVIGIGMDMVEVGRIKKAIVNDHFVKRVFTPAEIDYCQSRGQQAAQSFAARFAAKEAILKAFGTGLRGGKLTDLEILPNELGCPEVQLTGYFAELARKHEIKNIWLSLTHTKEYGAAQCVMEA
ncbi:holo-[acyl-carrier protein] synthase [Selenomonas ruminantium]|uniref:Holo-[acyl-carrier-protein] synthase n=1 Tax=Selenomonas ruminantium TaxID=971 RepID=A0A1M6WKQ3_SELRU|nr:holo-ACP synthase [Selenomonas ruminantium]SHK94281.1 holo-[acyl-carrier protein] synthase [Selenomonas ruminantium]